MRFIFLRHPQTVANDLGLIYGKKDYPYTDLGYEQFDKACEMIRTMMFEKIITSPIGRAKNLALAIGKDRAMDVKEDKALEEMGYGIFEGMTMDEAGERYPRHMKDFLEGTEGFILPESEGYDAFNDRVIGFLNQCLEADDDVLLVSHGGVLRTAIEYLLAAEPGFSWQFEIGNCAIVEIECTEGYHRLKNLWNQ